MSEDHLDIFMHVPKTGGTTLSAIFRKQYKPSEIFDHDSFQYKVMKMDQLKAEEKRNIKAVAGHYFYGIHQKFSPRPFNYFTMLRDPVDRVISSYYFLKDYPGYEMVKDMTLEEFVVNGPEASSLQTLLVCGSRKIPDIEKAKENLKTFTVVGVTELFNETLFCLKKEYSWGDIHYTRKNITKNRLAKEEVPLDLINLIRKYNALDLELYDYAKKLLYEKLQSLTVDEQKQLEKFKLEQSALN
ncbi:sulfotransferase family 2 domain-containing protein [Peribacillus frigoritolerans]|uniref:sulfotransferase family 2 domain-containing protein n=1 Tax=Peribacillus frigoritolerans TaxID=450367 RepID=UPI0037FD1BFA